MESLKSIVNSHETKGGKAFDLFFQVLIILSITLFSLESLPHLLEHSNTLDTIHRIVSVLFLVEYILRVYAAENKKKFIFSFYGVIDLIAILPIFFFHSNLNLKFIRIFRLLRIVRVFKLVRYTHAFDRLKRAFKSIRNELTVFSILAFILLYFSSSCIYVFENHAQPDKFESVFHAFWWSIATFTTVGYGDMVPVTMGGKIFTFFILFIGMAFVSIPSALIASALIKED